MPCGGTRTQKKKLSDERDFQIRYRVMWEGSKLNPNSLRIQTTYPTFFNVFGADPHSRHESADECVLMAPTWEDTRVY